MQVDSIVIYDHPRTVESRRLPRLEVFTDEGRYRVTFKYFRDFATIRIVAEVQRRQRRNLLLTGRKGTRGRGEIEGARPGGIQDELARIASVLDADVLDPVSIGKYWHQQYTRFVSKQRSYVLVAKHRSFSGRWRKLAGKEADSEEEKREDRRFRRAVFSRNDAGAENPERVRLWLGDSRATEITFSTDPDIREVYRSHAVRVLRAKLRARLGANDDGKQFRYVKRTFAELDREGDPLEELERDTDLVDFILAHKARTFVLCSDLGGAGKSTALLKIAEQIAKRSDDPGDPAFGKIPVYMECHRLGEDWREGLVEELGRQQSDEPGAPDCYLPSDKVSPADARIFFERAGGTSEIAPSKQRDLVLLIDGANEARHETFINKLESSLGGNIKIVAVPKDCLRWFKRHPDCQRLEVFPFSQSESTEFCKHVGEALPERLPGARDGEHVPLALRLWCQLSKERREGIQTSYGLYDAIVEEERAREEDKWEDVQERPGSRAPSARVDELFEILAAIAYEALGRGRTRVIDRRTLAGIIDSDGVRQAAGSRYPAGDIHKALEGYRTFIATIGDAGQLEFYHEQFCYFLAARHILSTLEFRDQQAVCQWLLAPVSCRAAHYLAGGLDDRGVLNDPGPLASLCRNYEAIRLWLEAVT